MVKIALVFIALFSGSAMAQYTGQRSSFVDWQCKYEWTPECEQQAMEEERFYRSQMLKQAQEQNEILKENQRLQEEQNFNEQQERHRENMRRWIR